MATSTVVETTYGPVRGVDHGNVKVWKGVRYGAPPGGDLRWRAPQPPEPWTTIMDASRCGPACPQPIPPSIPVDLGAPQGEDCLSLNIWSSTAPGDHKPVMVWVHGGAYVMGSAGQQLSDGTVLATSADVVIVTVNYRLGAFGFLDPSTYSTARRRYDTNVGLRDVIFALKWVRDNIARFGGDPNRVTLFGESAGGGIVTTLLTSPAADGLFTGAIVQSSPATSVYDAERAGRVAALLLDELGMDHSGADRISDVPASALVAAS